MLCRHDNMIDLKVIHESNDYFEDSLKICYCKNCDCIFKYKSIYKIGIGYDNFPIYPDGNEIDGIKFTIKEFIEVLKENKNLLEKNNFIDFDKIKIKDIKNIIIRTNQMNMYYNLLLKGLIKYFDDKEK